MSNNIKYRLRNANKSSSSLLSSTYHDSDVKIGRRLAEVERSVKDLQLLVTALVKLQQQQHKQQRGGGGGGQRGRALLWAWATVLTVVLALTYIRALPSETGSELHAMQGAIDNVWSSALQSAESLAALVMYTAAYVRTVGYAYGAECVQRATAAAMNQVR